MRKLYTSNQLEILCQQLADNLGMLNGDIFGKEVILTQTSGMASWVKTELARRNGIFANFEFLNQDGLFAGIFQLVSGKKLKNNINETKYKIFRSLDNSGFKESFPEVAGYYAGNDLRRIQLSEKIADLFDQYQLYRNEMIESWDKGNLLTDNQAEKWQMWLWRNLDIESRSKIMARLTTEMKARKDLIKKTYPRISMFGITVYTKFHFDFFTELAEYTDIDFYLCPPTNQKEYKNELLLSYGSKATELMSMFDIRNFNCEVFNGDSLLNRIQNQISNNSVDLEYKEDNSVLINSCYTPVREVECLYNYLLDLFEKDKEKKELKPGDILVMATDINKYAPFIKAVFKNAPVKIPFKVSGEVKTNEDSITGAIEQILNFTENDLTSEKVISLLEHKRIKQHFQIADCNYIRSVLKKANIRFGHENRIEDDSFYVSWKYGLEKILLGYAMLTDEEYPVGDNYTLYPFKDTEATESYDLLRLKSFVERIEYFIDAEKESRTLLEWKGFLFEEVIEKMIYLDDFNKDDRAELNSVYKALSFIDSLEFDEKVPFKVFLDELDSKLFKESQEMKLNTGMVTVSSPIPVRGIPFKVICFLGMNNDVFPRKDNFMGFDLLGEEYRDGDRNKKETDKYLFLDTLLAAREYLYISYLGQSVKDNTEIPSSIVLDTFKEYIGSEKIIMKHPMHGFSSEYHKKAREGMFTYLYNSQPHKEYATIEKPDNEKTEVSVQSLIKFFQAPVEWYYNNILDINYDDNENTLPDTELFELDNFQKWIIRKEVLKLKEEEIGHWEKKYIIEGHLPLKSAGSAAVESIKEDVFYLKQEYINLVNNREETRILIDKEINDIRIKGTIDSVYDRDFIAFSVSKYPVKYKIEAYIKSLLLFAEKKIDSAQFLDLSGNVSQVPVTAESAYTILSDLLEYYKEGNTTPLLFTIKAYEKTAEIDAKKAKAAAKKEKNETAGKPDKKDTKPEKEDKTEGIQVVKTFEEEAQPPEGSILDPNLYLQILFRENRFEKFGDMEVAKIREIANKLGLNNF